MTRKSVFLAIAFLSSALLVAGLSGNPDAASQAASPPKSGGSLTTFSTSLFTGSGVCAFCHSELRDSAGNDVSMDTHWRSTMMANAAKDPLWQAKVSSEVSRNPDLKEVIENKCSTCHMPMAHTQAVADGTSTLIFQDGFTSKNHDLNKAAMDGVSCTACHQIQNVGLEKQKSFSGKYRIDSGTSKPNRLIYGPFPSPLQNQMRGFSGFKPVYSNHVKKSGLCATCHTLYTPFVDGEGKVLGEFPEQTPYLEWEHSDFSTKGKKGKSCQDCHMPKADGPVVISNRPAGMGGMGGPLTPREPFVKHHFVGGNIFMLDILKALISKLGLTASTKQFDATRERTLIQLQNDTAELSIVEGKINGSALEIRLRVENKTGHKFPSGFPSRRAWLELRVVDAKGKTVFTSGKPRADGSINGNDADQAETAFEPHYDLITSGDQVQIYEPVMQNSDGEVTYTLLRAAAYVKDNRMLPSGFKKRKAGDDIAVRGKAGKDKNFVGGSDQITYRIDVGGFSAPVSVSAKLHFQTVSFRFVKDLGNDNTAQIRKFLRYYKKANKKPVLIASADTTVK